MLQECYKQDRPLPSPPGPSQIPPLPNEPEKLLKTNHRALREDPGEPNNPSRYGVPGCTWTACSTGMSAFKYKNRASRS
jgi:hypothetical protein